MEAEQSVPTNNPVSQNLEDSPAENKNSGEYPVQVNIEYPAHQSRIWALFSLPFFLARFLALLPHFIVLYVLQIISLLAAWLNVWVILFTGKSSPGLHKFVTGTLRWSTRVSAFTYGLSDKYPPFRLEP